jgi:transcriptional regulator with XRE-family HTH domain
VENARIKPWVCRREFADVLGYKRISDYELGKNEPPLSVILAYARLAKVSTDVLIDDRLTLPKKYLRTL